MCFRSLVKSLVYKDWCYGAFYSTYIFAQLAVSWKQCDVGFLVKHQILGNDVRDNNDTNFTLNKQTSRLAGKMNKSRH